MTRQQRTRLMKYGISTVLTAAAVIYYAASRNVFQLEKLEMYRVLCDAFTLPGFFVMLFGLMMLMNELGALDTLAYFGHYLLHTFLPVAFGEGQSYLDFMEERRSKRTKGYGFLFIVGGAFTLVGVVFLILFLKLDMA